MDELKRRPIKKTKSEDHPSSVERNQLNIITKPIYRQKRKEKDESDSDSSTEESGLYPDISSELEEIKTSPTKNSKIKLSYTVVNDVVIHIKNNSQMLLIALICISIASFLCMQAGLFMHSQSRSENVTQVIKSLKSKFQDQPAWTYKILSSALKQVVNSSTEPSAPAIITVLANQGATDTAIYFCTYLATLLVSNEYVMIDDRIYGQGNDNDIKNKIDEEIKSKVEFSSLNVVVVDQLEKIPLNATMIFHSYCDHDTASFKRVVYMFVLSLNEDLTPTANPKELDKVAFKHYRETWKDAHPDIFESLITRLTVNVINVKLIDKVAST